MVARFMLPSILVFLKNMENTLAKITECIVKIRIWLSDNNLTLNYSKSDFFKIIFFIFLSLATTTIRSILTWTIWTHYTELKCKNLARYS